MAKRYEYDVFISHAVEDKIAIANELWYRLKKEGLEVWYSGRELLAGDSLVETIHDGLENSRYGVVILSPNFIAGNWALREFYTLLAQEERNRKKIIPIHLNITAEDLANVDPTMADRFAIDADKGMDHVVKRILERIGRDRKKEREQTGKKVRRNVLIVAITLLIVAVIGYGGYTFYSRQFPSHVFIARIVQQRVDDVQKTVNQQVAQMRSSGAVSCSLQAIDSLYTAYTNTESYYRNAYEFDNGYATVRFRKNVELALNVSFETVTPYNAYQFTDPAIYKLGERVAGAESTVQYAFMNTQAVRYTVVDTKAIEDKYVAVVHYDNNLRSITVSLTFPASSADIKRHDMNVYGLFPEEEYVFEREGEQWKLKTVERPEE